MGRSDPPSLLALREGTRSASLPGESYGRRVGHFLLPPLLLCLFVLAGGCGVGPPGTPAPTPDTEPRLPALEPNPDAVTSPEERAALRRLLEGARRSLESGAFQEARERAAEVRRRYAELPGSAEALWLEARALLSLDRRSEAAEAALTFAELVEPTEPEGGQALLLAGRALAALGDVPRAIRVLHRIPEAAPGPVIEDALEMLRREVQALRHGRLVELAEELPAEPSRLHTPLLVELALSFHGRGEAEEGEEIARRALELEPKRPEEELARSILSGTPAASRRLPAMLGAVLSRSGSPSQRELSEWIIEGIRARLEGDAIETGAPVRVEERDDEGSPELAQSVAVELIASAEAVGVIGPLGVRQLEAVARARPEPVPLISPTARLLPEGEPAVYSLRAPDPEGGSLLARHALAEGLDEAVILQGSDPSSIEESEFFARAFQEEGGRILERATVPSGATFFEDPLNTVRNRRPSLLFLALRPDEIELLAPQITYFGVDTLGIRFFGTSDWAEPGALAGVDTRHTDGIVVATPRPPGGEPEAYRRFVQAYERVLRQTLRSRVPALGYDAAGLLVEALGAGARSPEELREALEGIRDFEGATGVISVVDGRIRRRHYLVRLRDGDRIPIPVHGGEETEAEEEREGARRGEETSRGGARPEGRRVEVNPRNREEGPR